MSLLCAPKLASKRKVWSVSALEALSKTLTEVYGQTRAPIMDLLAAQTRDPYKILVGTLLSARTQDQTTAAAIERLFSVAPTMDALAQLSVEEIERLIFPVGFYHAKARYLVKLPEALKTHFCGVIPKTVEELVQLPGVGRKTANLVVALAFRLPAICVDTHVHRINNRLGIVHTKTATETEKALRRLLPEHLWMNWNAIFVSFGQTRCRPIGPKCDGCPIAELCPQDKKKSKA